MSFGSHSFSGRFGQDRTEKRSPCQDCPVESGRSVSPLVFTHPLWALAQNPQGKSERGKVGAEDLPGPEPIQPAVLSKPSADGHCSYRRAGFNLQMVDTSLAARRSQAASGFSISHSSHCGMRTVEIPGKGRKIIYYMYYRIVNRTGEPRLFVPQFSIVTNTQQAFRRHSSASGRRADPGSQKIPSTPLLGSVDMVGIVPPSTKEGVDDAVFGVAIWNDFDLKASRFSVYVEASRTVISRNEEIQIASDRLPGFR